MPKRKKKNCVYVVQDVSTTDLLKVGTLEQLYAAYPILATVQLDLSTGTTRWIKGIRLIRLEW